MGNENFSIELSLNMDNPEMVQSLLKQAQIIFDSEIAQSEKKQRIKMLALKMLAMDSPPLNLPLEITPLKPNRIISIPPPPISIINIQAIESTSGRNQLPIILAAKNAIERAEILQQEAYFEREKSLNRLMRFAYKQPMILDSLEDLPKQKLSRRERRKMYRK